MEMVACHQDAGLANVESIKYINECTCGDTKYFDNGVTKDVESQRISSRENSAPSCTSTNKQPVSTTSTKVLELIKETRKACTWKRISRIIMIYSFTALVSLILTALSSWFSNYCVSTLWTPSGYFMLLLILWYPDGEVITTMYGGLLTGYTIHRFWIMNDAAPANPFFADTQLFIISICGDVVQVTIGGAGLSWWYGKELREMKLHNILSYNFFVTFVLISVLIAPAALAACNMMGYLFMKEADESLSYGKIQLMWLIAGSTSSLSILWAGLVIAATINGRVEVMRARRAALNKSKRRNGNVCFSVPDIAELLFGDVQFQWFYIVVEMILCGFYILFSDFWLYPEVLNYDFEPSILGILLLSWVSWRHEPIFVVLFSLFCTVSSSTMVNKIVAPTSETIDDVKYYRMLIDLYMSEIVTSITAIFIMITVQKYRNITLELKRENEKLYVALTNVEDIKNEAQLFASISHELTTPLNVIQGFSTEITEHGGVPTEVLFYAKQISEASEHILSTISNLLEHFHQYMLSFWTIRNCPVDLHIFWAKTCSKVVSLGQQCSVKVNYRISENVPCWVKTDECRLAQIILNLGSNAAQYTSGDKVVEVAERREIGPHCQKMNVDLELTYCPDISSIKMRISDTGECIKAELHKRIEHMLERCNQNVDDLQNQKPVCGLNNAAGIAREMGGTIKIDSKVGERTELNVTIPVLYCKSPTNGIQEQSTCTTRAINNTNIMIVEDSTMNRGLLDRMLRRLGYNSIVQACNGLDALNHANESSIHFDIVLLDLSMSIMGGLELLTHLLEYGRLDSLVNTPIIITSGHVSDGMWDELEALGAEGRVDKPYDQEQISEAIRAAYYCPPTISHSGSSI